MIDLKSKIMNLPSLGTITTTHNLTPYRALGQNFLFDLNLTRKIAKAAKFSSNETIIEIGPGPFLIRLGFNEKEPGLFFEKAPAL